MHVLAADAELPTIRERLSRYKLNYRYLPHSDFIDSFPAHRGWTMQQFLKLMAARAIDAPFYLSIDSDHLLTRALTPEDLVRNGRSIVTPEPVAHHLDWWKGSAEILGVEPLPETSTGITISCVPMATGIARELVQHLEDTKGDAWTEILMDRHDWVDYALYYTYVHGTGRAGSTHDFGPLLSVHHSVWHPGDFENWDANAAFTGDHHFVCIQSNTDTPPDSISEKIRPLLECQGLS